MTLEEVHSLVRGDKILKFSVFLGMEPVWVEFLDYKQHKITLFRDLMCVEFVYTNNRDIPIYSPDIELFKVPPSLKLSWNNYDL